MRVKNYLIQDINATMTPIRPDLEAGFSYFFYFLTERGRAGLTARRRDIAKVFWTRNSPSWRLIDATLDRAAAAFDNPDYMDAFSTPTATDLDWRPATRCTRGSSSS